MRIFVTGATGFVGGWLMKELAEAGHTVTAAPAHEHLPITEAGQVRDAIAQARPDAIVHLAAVSFGPDAAADPAEALRTNIGGTLAVIGAALKLDQAPLLLVVSSSEVYGPIEAGSRLTERSPLHPMNVYGLTKVAEESVALSAATTHGLPVIVVRPFNHTGPGQRTSFAVPAFVARALAVQAGTAAAIPVGNLDVRRDVGDVRDVVRAYRLLLDAWRDRRLGEKPMVFNIATGQPVSMRAILDDICDLLGIEPRVSTDPRLVRTGDPLEIAGDASALTSATGWVPTIPIRQTLTDMIGATRERFGS